MKYEYADRIEIYINGDSVDIEPRHQEKMVAWIDAFNPNEPAGEWWVDMSYEDIANGEVWPVRPCDDVVNIPVCLCLDKETAERIVRDHKPKYPPDDVEAIVLRLKITVQQLIAMECTRGAEILEEDIEHILKGDAE